VAILIAEVLFKQLYICTAMYIAKNDKLDCCIIMRFLQQKTYTGPILKQQNVCLPVLPLTWEMY